MPAFNSPLQAFLYWEKRTPSKTFLRQPVNGQLLMYSYQEVGLQARKIAAYLSSHGFEKRAHIALISKNCAHWVIADLAIMMAGFISIPLYPSLDAKSIKQIVKHSEAKAIIVGKLDNFELQYQGMKGLSLIGIELYNISKGTSWETVIDTTEPIADHEIKYPASDDLHTIIYTSGTTGSPKGVMHSVGNLIKSGEALMSVMAMDENSRVFSYLPLAHVAERVGETLSLVSGAQMTFPESLETFANDLEQTQPTTFFGVPRIYAKFQEKILEKIPQKVLSALLKTPVVNSIVKKKLQTKLGLRQAKMIGCGAAPLSIDLIHWYASIGINIMQLYGMTEDCCVSHANVPGANKIGTVGKAHESVQIKISSDGELLIKNDCLFKGYYKDVEKTVAVFDNEGFFRTGDKGEYDHKGFLTITGRAKDEFKTDKGKYVSPLFLELELAKNSNIETLCVVGTGIPQPMALVTLSELGQNQSRKNLVESFATSLERVNTLFEKHERLEKVVVMKEQWTIENGLITPSLKVRRNAIEKLHQPCYNQWFQLKDQVIFEV